MSMNSMQGYVLEKQLLGTYLSPERPQYLPYKDALKKATRLKQGKLVELAESMGLKVYYSRVMDVYHGVDAIVVDPEKKSYVTVDVSVSPKEIYKADINIVSNESPKWKHLLEQAMRLYAKLL